MPSWLVVYPALQAIICTGTRRYAWSLAALAFSGLDSFRYTYTCYHCIIFYWKIITVRVSAKETPTDSGGSPVEAQTDIQTYLEQGKQALAKGQGREAAIA